jgi:adenosylmethionine-8-amino-7-oxononanoate aminotransferase
MEAALKLARQIFLEKQPPEPQRVRFISRRQSYHGITLGALSVSGHAYRRAKFEPLMSDNTSHVSACNPLRGKMDGDSDEQYVAKLANELDEEFQRVGPETVCAFIAEPVVGAVRRNVQSHLMQFAD